MIATALALMLAGAPVMMLQQSAAPVAEDAMPSTPEALQAIHAFGACAADASADRAAEVLRMDFRTSDYRVALRKLSDSNRGCFRKGEMRSNGMLFAGALAERLLARNAEPLNVRLSRVAGATEASGFNVSDKLATCVARSLPDQTAALFATLPGTAEEATAVDGLNVGIARCAEAIGTKADISTPGLRAIIATAAFRAVSSTPKVG